MRKQVSLPTYYFGHVISVLKEAGVQVDKWLASQNLNLSELIENDARVSVDSFDALMKIVIEKHGFSDFGISVGKRLKIAHHGDFGLAVLNCPSMIDVLDFHQQYLSIRLPFVSFNYESSGANIVITLTDNHWQKSLHRSVIEAVSIAIVNMLESINFQDASTIEISEACFDYGQPPYVEKYSALKTDRLSFNQEHSSISFPSTYVDKQLAMVDEFSFQRALVTCKKELDLYRQQTNSTKDAVYALLSKEGGCQLSLEQIAELLHISKRTLHRNLENEGTSFKLLLKAKRADLAKRLLLHDNKSVGDVADELGYSDSANFRRAFKDWYGVSPKAWVREMRG
jgi:AraC-like DNA-binding protein